MLALQAVAADTYGHTWYVAKKSCHEISPVRWGNIFGFGEAKVHEPNLA
jgi:hypothetical protein